MNKIDSILEITSNSIKLIQAEKGKDNPNIIAFDETSSLDPETLKNFVNKHKIHKTNLTLVLPRNQVFLKKISIPPGSLEEIRTMLRFEAERYLPFSTDSAIIDFYLQENNSKDSHNDINLVAVKQEALKKYLDILIPFNLMPNKITFSTISIYNLINLDDNFKENTAFVIVGNDSWEINIYSKNQVISSRGFAEIPSEITFKDELANTFNMFYNAGEFKKIDKIVYMGLNKNEGFLKAIKEGVSMPVLEFDFNGYLNKFTLPQNIQKEQLRKYITLIPLLMNSQININLLPDDVKKSNEKSKEKKTQIKFVAIFLSFVLVLSAAFYILKYKKNTEDRRIAGIVQKNKKEILELARIEEKVAKIDNYKKDNLLALEILKDITSNLGSNVYIKQFDYNLLEKTLTLRARASSYAVASKTVSIISKSKYFLQVSNKGSYMAKVGDNNLVDFEVLCVLKQ